LNPITPTSCTTNLTGKKKLSFLFALVLFFLSGIISVQAFPLPDSTAASESNLPTLSIGTGNMSFIGDVGSTHLNEPLLGTGGFQVELQKHTNNGLSFSLFLLSGKVSGNEKTVERTLNFESSIVSEGIQVRYDFINRKKKQQVLIPFVSAGIEYIVFHPKSDLKDANGNTYHYWKDGTIRNLDQADPNAEQAVIIHRDYSNETDLREADLDGLGKFNETAFGFPVGVGARLMLSRRCAVSFSSVCHFTNTDYIDGVTSESLGSRKGNSSNDKFLYTSVSFRYDFSAPRVTPRSSQSKTKPYIDASKADFTSIAKEDADHDGVPDVNDDDPFTPENAKVDAHGKALDTDQDGIPDYRDEEENSAKDAIVNEDGITITDEMIEEKFRRDSLAALPSIREYLKNASELNSSEPSPKPDSKSVGGAKEKLTIPVIYKKVDKDSNGVISSQEISTAIDEYLAGKSSYSTDEFFKLIDFYFKQN
jgi:hypothetical protein